MRREICGECDTPINDDGSCICTELLKRGWRLCAKGQQTTQWCAMAETLLHEQRQRDEALLRQALGVLEELQYAVVSTAKTDDVSLYYRAIVALRDRLRREADKGSE